jgi:hypothetical protein
MPNPPLYRHPDGPLDPPAEPFARIVVRGEDLTSPILLHALDPAQVVPLWTTEDQAAWDVATLPTETN